MSVLYVVLPAALILALIGVFFFVWAVKGGQFDDLKTPGIRMLHDDDPSPPRGEEPPSEK